MRKPGGAFYGISLEKKIEKIILNGFQNGISFYTVNDLINQLEINFDDFHADYSSYQRIYRVLQNLNQEKTINLIKEPGYRDIPTLKILPHE